MEYVGPGLLVLALIVSNIIIALLQGILMDRIGRARRRRKTLRALSDTRAYLNSPDKANVDVFVEELAAGLIASGFQAATLPDGTVVMSRGESTFLIRAVH